MKNDIQKFIPTVLIIGRKIERLYTVKYSDYECSDINVINVDNSSYQIIDAIKKYNPDIIVTFGDNYKRYKTLCDMPINIRKKWLHCEDDYNLANIVYSAAMNNILTNDTSKLVSIFTPILNTGSILYRTYESIKNQTYENWEWVVVDDGDDENTKKIMQDLSNLDLRIKYYDLNPKSNGVIGEAKYRACSLCSGDYLLELDHDDYLLKDSLQYVINAFNEFPDAGFAYSNSAEIDDFYKSLTYSPGFALGYGYYRDFEYELDGKTISSKFAVSPNINPKTIRHIVGCPNHFRVWKKDAYFLAKGHNRLLSIADDYELIVRTFLTTKMIKIDNECYLQFLNKKNTQDIARSEIQRKVRYISSFYNDQIKNRFEELGKKDWAYESFKTYESLIYTKSQYGDNENYANYVIKF